MKRSAPPACACGVLGFSLIEILIVLAIAAAVTAFFLDYMNTERLRTARGQIISDQARDMSILGSSLEAYLATKPAPVPADGTSVAITSQTLSDLSFLPVRFAVRNKDLNDHVARSPLGQTYVIKARQISGRYVGAVYTIGAPSVDQLAVFGMKATDQAYQEHHTSVMRRLSSVHYAAAGIVVQGQSGIDGSISGFDADLTPYEASAFANSNIVLLVGHPEYRAVPPVEIKVTESGGGGGAGGSTSTCTYASAGQACPAGSTEVLAWTACDSRAGSTAASFTGSFGSVALTLTDRTFFELGGGSGTQCTSKYAGVNPYLPRVGTEHQMDYTYGESIQSYGTAWARQAVQSASWFNMGPVAAFHMSTYSESGPSCSGNYSSYTGSCSADLSNPAYVVQSTYTCGALSADASWEPMWYAPGSGVPLGTNRTNYCPFAYYNGDATTRAVGYSRDMVVTWNGSRIATYRGCVFGLPIDGRTGPEQDASWRSKLGIGATKIQPPCPAEQPRGQTGYTTERWGATKIFNVPQAGGGKICCS